MTSAELTMHPVTAEPANFQAFLSTLDEPSWLIELRKSAYAVYQEKLAAPLDPEEWKRVDLRTFRPERYSLKTTPPPETSFDTLLEQHENFAGHISHVDGQTISESLEEEFASQGVLFGSLTRLAHEHQELLEPLLMKRAVPFETDRFSAWHAAFCTGGTLLYVPRNVQLTKPLHSLIALASDQTADFSHTLVILEDGASATLLEETISADPQSAGLHIGSVELILGDEAHLQYVQLQNWNEKTIHIAHQAGRVGRDAHLQWTVSGLGAKIAHIHQDVMLDGRGAHAQVNGVTFATDRQLLSYYTKQSHNAPDTKSDLLYKQVLRDKSRVVWRGMIRVEPAAQLTDGYQRCDALMLSPTARADSIPGLEIEADDVRCTHGATAGRVDEEQVFYAMCRGLTKYEAMHMIVEGFFHTIYDRISVEAVRKTLSQTVERKLGIGE
jgi:Fe-S cluster assembly protein SufD